MASLSFNATNLALSTFSSCWRSASTWNAFARACNASLRFALDLRRSRFGISGMFLLILARIELELQVRGVGKEEGLGVYMLNFITS